MSGKANNHLFVFPLLCVRKDESDTVVIQSYQQPAKNNTETENSSPW